MNASESVVLTCLGVGIPHDAVRGSATRPFPVYCNYPSAAAAATAALAKLANSVNDPTVFVVSPQKNQLCRPEP